MYKLNQTMINHFKKYLEKYHELFDCGRCSSWQLEELIVKSIKKDLSNTDVVKWSGNNHKIECDILINNKIQLQIKSGKIDKLGINLILSGYRLGRFKEDLEQITKFINQNNSFIITIPYHKNEEQTNKRHIYQICYLPKDIFKISKLNIWKKKKKDYFLINNKGVEFKIAPSMSWQIWWTIPLKLIQEKSEILKV
ncbi:MAG: hypothetical protein ACQBVK_03940 [Candidatus Phytoplasma sp. TWB_XP]